MSEQTPRYSLDVASFEVTDKAKKIFGRQETGAMLASLKNITGKSRHQPNYTHFIERLQYAIQMYNNSDAYHRTLDQLHAEDADEDHLRIGFLGSEWNTGRFEDFQRAKVDTLLHTVYSIQYQGEGGIAIATLKLCQNGQRFDAPVELRKSVLNTLLGVSSSSL